MALTVRLYLIEEDGTIKRIPRRVADKMTSGDDAIPAYAGTRQRVLELIVENEGGKAQGIIKTIGYYLDFDPEGRVDESLRENLRAVMNAAFPEHQSPEDNVVSMKGRREHQIWEERNRWKPEPQLLDPIIADLARKPGTKALPSVDGFAAKHAPLSYEAKSALNEIGSKLSLVPWSVGQLSERSLPGFIQQARKRAKDEPEEQYFWEAAAFEGERQLELKRLRRTGKGTWVALFEIYRHTGPSSVEEAFTKRLECDGEAAAVEAMKELVREHHGLMGPGHSMESRTMPLLEWKLMNRWEG
ncbi:MULTISPECIES: hypothetical protein [unclassified Bosea (in: a-proteobacteria)]|uniref:hypothetical protein n=1 Tax=unclassified Bosea (in: a-proteobacteria) TaxID=2653178 RepID=UPI000F74FB8C|nr:MULTISPECIES: hypothetical protein [unclassified Bosea (in: a-proteobacteria)]AZO79621.1 hypothetical protein BLM15_19945 [Bosea sp. Tri-49]RXT16135.1 hypothetical protein B5U98_29455 [Bosea sp. Tri-39]RXT39827.1 hypothetical protein B5U99_06500 [Bosea sp. Tri-54]